MRFSCWPFQTTRTAWALIVIPRSRSSSIVSSTCSRISRCVTAFVSSRMRSASVDLPWSMCAMIEKLRMLRAGALTLRMLGGARARPAPEHKPADLMGLGHPHAQHGTGVDVDPGADAAAHAHDLRRQRVPEHGV